MKRIKVKNLLMPIILTLGILLVMGCEKENIQDNTLSDGHLNVSKNKSLTKITLNEIIDNKQISKKNFGIKSKGHKKTTGKPSYEIYSKSGLKYIHNDINIYVFLMRRTDISDGAYYNYKVFEKDGKIQKYIERFPYDSSEEVTTSRIVNETNGNKSKSIAQKDNPEFDIYVHGPENCIWRIRYSVNPCPCVGHIDRSQCRCHILPIWIEKSRVKHSCTTPRVNDPDITENDEDIKPRVGIDDNTGCFRTSNGQTQCFAPEENDEASGTPTLLMKHQH